MAVDGCCRIHACREVVPTPVAVLPRRAVLHPPTQSLQRQLLLPLQPAVEVVHLDRLQSHRAVEDRQVLAQSCVAITNCHPDRVAVAHRAGAAGWVEDQAFQLAAVVVVRQAGQRHQQRLQQLQPGAGSGVGWRRLHVVVAAPW